MSETINVRPILTTWGIRAKILSLVILAVLLPTALVGTSSYLTARAALTAKLSDQLETQASLAATKITEWFRERAHDAQVFANANVVATSLEQSVAPDDPTLPSYLAEVRERFPVYRGLAVMRRTDDAVAATGEFEREELVRARSSLAQVPLYVDWESDAPHLWVDAIIRNSRGEEAGSFLLSCSFDSLLEELTQGEASHRIRLIDSSDRALLAHPLSEASELEMQAEPASTNQPFEYRDSDGRNVLAVLQPIAIPGVAEPLVLHIESKDDLALTAVDELRRRVFFMSFLVVAVILPLAYTVVVSFTKPLETLTRGAKALSKGDYSLLPVRTSDEIGYLTEVFNRMTTTLKENHDSLQQLSVTDELTKLCNRRQLSRALAEELARAQRNCRPLSVIMIDIDHFKRYNDQFGHLRGDAVLESFGAFLIENLRSTDIPARYGGEEFVVVLPETDIAEALAKAERLREGFTESVEEAFDITLSLGVAGWPGDGDSDRELLEAADRALYAAKDRGRDRVVVYSELSR